mgnify:CR=1 FL=1
MNIFLINCLKIDSFILYATETKSETNRINTKYEIYFSFLWHLPSQRYSLEMISPRQGSLNSLLADRRTTSDAHLLIFGTGFPFQQAFPEGANKTNYNYSDVD